jgi:hypothetical protein
VADERNTLRCPLSGQINEYFDFAVRAVYELCGLYGL